MPAIPGSRTISFFTALPSILIAALLCSLILSAPLVAQEAAAEAALQKAAARPLITESVDESQTTTLRGNTHPLARPESDLGVAPATLPMKRMLLVLRRSSDQETALRKRLDDQQDKASPNYHKWLSPEQFGQQFGPTDTDIQTITAWLQSHGFEVGSTKGRTVLEFSGSASQVQQAFHTTIHKYIVNSEQHWANASDPQIPTALTPAVAGIDSLHDFRRKPTNSFAGRYSEKTKQLSAAQPDYSYGCRGSQCYAVVPYDFATIYDVLPLWNSGINGSGQTIAIVGRTNINPQDATDFWTLFGVSVPANKLNIILNGVDPGINGDEGEADIDVQWSGAVAPQAAIDFVTSESTETTDGIDLSAVYVVDNNLAPVMSESYGECELGLGTAGNQFYSGLWEQAAAQGISVFVSSGDNGAAGCDVPSGPAQYGLNVNGIASTPFNAAVGGTDFNQYNKWTTYWNSTNNPTTQESAKGYIPETTWNDSCTNALAVSLGYGSTAERACNNSQMIAQGGVNSTGGGGGPSNCVVNSQTIGSCNQGYAKPSWQSGAGVPNDNRRDLPDISLFASNGFLGSFYLICQQDQTGGVCDLNDFAGYGGTSVASPAFAGIMSLVNQKTGTPQGVPGFALYKLVPKQANAFHDVPSGSTIAMPCIAGTPNCTVVTPGDTYGVLSGYSTGTGYDLATGLGSVDAANLVNNWTKASFTATSASLQLNSGNAVNVKHGTAVPVNIGVTPTAATGDASLLVSTGSGTTTGQAIDAFSLSSGMTPAGTTTSQLPGGTYNVIAHYGGDGTYGGSYSSPVSVTVSKENSQPQVFLLTFDSNGNILSKNTTTATYGSPYLLRVNVENAAGQMCAPVASSNATACPSGNVALTDNGGALDAGTYALNSYGYVEDLTVQLPGGADSVEAAYAGDNSFNANSVTTPITITPAGTNMNPPNVPTAYVGSGFGANAMVQSLSSGLPPTGTITFYSNGSPVSGTTTYQSGNQTGPPTFAWLTASFTSSTSALPSAGNYTITASYSGDGNYTASKSLETPIAVQYPPLFPTTTPYTQNVAIGATASLTVLMASQNKTVYPTGTITFSSGNVVLAGPTPCTSTKDSLGDYACQAVASFTANTAMSVLAQYSGDANYPGASTDAIVNVNDFAIGIDSSSIVTMGQGQSQTAQLDVSDLGAFYGTVSNFTCSGFPAETTCSFNPTQVTGSGATILTITTTPTGQLRHRAARESRQIGWTATAMFPLLGICLIGIPAWRRGALLAFLMVALFLTMPSCGGGGGGGQVINNPVPSITSLSPTQQAAGSGSQALTITGSGFVSGSTVTYNNVAHYIDSYWTATQLAISLTPGDLATAGSFPVVVTNPAPGGGTSSAVDFNVVTGTPTGTFNVTITGTSGSLTHTANFTLIVQ
ncbi:MAG TPA: protease pro-enzyme activation domain-containing protein [Candidatus Acidoferrum sp.]|nr:protease pro-enzyme activation domain-containing protein [Candidatus Acidoferrum sp.]